MKLIWSLANRNPQTPHNQYVYDLFYLSISLAKDLGYDTILYGTSDALVRIGEYVDEVYNVDDVEYLLFDDVKIHIWETRNDDYFTLDGDMFLFSKINLEKELNPFIYFDELIETKNNDNLQKFLNIINVKQLVPEWNDSNKAITTNLIKWKANNGLLQYYINCYKKLRESFLVNENLFKNISSEFVSNNSYISHILCEQLLEKIISYYGLSYDELNSSNKNIYTHWQGSEKFENKNKINSVKLIVEVHKMKGGDVKSVYNSLLSQKLIYPIFEQLEYL